jgi:hypothetical protein
MPPSRANSSNVISPFGSAPIDDNHKQLDFAKSVLAEDSTGTPVTSPITGTSPITLNIPEDAVAVILVHDATAQASTMTFNGQPGTFGIFGSQVLTIPCASPAFKTLAINPGSASTNIYFAFELI